MCVCIDRVFNKVQLHFNNKNTHGRIKEAMAAIRISMFEWKHGNTLNMQQRVVCLTKYPLPTSASISPHLNVLIITF